MFFTAANETVKGALSQAVHPFVTGPILEHYTKIQDYFMLLNLFYDCETPGR